MSIGNELNKLGGEAIGTSPSKSFGSLFAKTKEKLDNLQASIAGAIFPSIPGQPAGKYFDIALGVDFHTTKIPPLPLCPVPQVAMVFDIMGALFGYLDSVIPAPPAPPEAEAADGEKQSISVHSVAKAIVTMMKPSVQVNNQWIANAGTALQTLPGVFLHVVPLVTPMASAEMFMGSATVLADGSPFSYQFLPALSCNLVGIPAPFRPKKPSKPKMSLMAPTCFLTNVFPKGKPVLVGGPPTIDLFALLVNLGLKGLGKLWKRGPGKFFKKLMEKAKKAKKKAGSKFKQALKDIKCKIFGDPVDVATGRVYGDNEEFSLPGPIPLIWERKYYSDVVVKTPMGYNWHHSYDIYHTKTDDGIIELHLPDGRSIGVPELIKGESFRHLYEKIDWAFDGLQYSYKAENGLTYIFEQNHFKKDRYYITKIVNDAGEQIQFFYTRNLLEI